MSLGENIRLAVAAYNYTKAVVHKGADNRADDMHSTNGYVGKLPLQRFLPEILQPTLTAELATKQRVAITQIMNSELPVTRELEIAKVVAASGIGRCGEQSVVAFTYLLHHTSSIPFGIVHIDWGNHEFVVIGAEEGEVKGVHSLTAPPRWNKDAVILDCWAKCHFVVAQHWTSEVPRILKQTVPLYDKDVVQLTPIIFHQWHSNPVYKPLVKRSSS